MNEKKAVHMSLLRVLCESHKTELWIGCQKLFLVIFVFKSHNVRLTWFLCYVATRPCGVLKAWRGERWERERTNWIPENGKFVVEAQAERRRISRAIALVIVITHEFSIYHSNRAHATGCPTSRIVRKRMIHVSEISFLSNNKVI